MWNANVERTVVDDEGGYGVSRPDARRQLICCSDPPPAKLSLARSRRTSPDASRRTLNWTPPVFDVSSDENIRSTRREIQQKSNMRTTFCARSGVTRDGNPTKSNSREIQQRHQVSTRSAGLNSGRNQTKGMVPIQLRQIYVPGEKISRRLCFGRSRPEGGVKHGRE